jgi:hypothetical protein
MTLYTIFDKINSFKLIRKKPRILHWKLIEVEEYIILRPFSAALVPSDLLYTNCNLHFPKSLPTVFNEPDL